LQLKHVVRHFLLTEIKTLQNITFGPNSVEHFNKESVYSEGIKTLTYKRASAGWINQEKPQLAS